MDILERSFELIYRTDVENPFIGKPMNALTLQKMEKIIQKVQDRTNFGKYFYKIYQIIDFLNFTLNQDGEADPNLMFILTNFEAATQILILIVENTDKLLKDENSHHEPTALHGVAKDLSITLQGYVMKLASEREESFHSDVLTLVRFFLWYISEYNDSWYYVLICSASMDFIHDMYLKSNYNIHDLYAPFMSKICKTIERCGDYRCQVALTKLLIDWLKTVDESFETVFLNKCFKSAENENKKLLLKDSPQSDDYKCRVFLLNLNLNTTHLVSIEKCLYFYTESEEIVPEQQNNIQGFWMSFSKRSKQISFSIASDENQTNIDVNIEKGLIKNACFFWTGASNVLDSHLENYRADPEANSDSFFPQSPKTDSDISSFVKFIAFIHLSLELEFRAIANLENDQYESKELFLVFNDPKSTMEALKYIEVDFHKSSHRTCCVPDELKDKIKEEMGIELNKIFSHKKKRLNFMEENESIVDEIESVRMAESDKDDDVNCMEESENLFELEENEEERIDHSQINDENENLDVEMQMESENQFNCYENENIPENHTQTIDEDMENMSVNSLSYYESENREIETIEKEIERSNDFNYIENENKNRVEEIERIGKNSDTIDTTDSFLPATCLDIYDVNSYEDLYHGLYLKKSKY